MILLRPRRRRRARSGSTRGSASRCWSLPEATANALLLEPTARSSRSRLRGRPRTAADGAAPFSSWGLAFDGGIKPDSLAPGVGLVTVGAGRRRRQLGFATVSGSSAAAAVVAGAAALLAEARPELERRDPARAPRRRRAPRSPGRRSRRRARASLDLGRSAAAELVADPPTLAFGRGTRRGLARRRGRSASQRLDAPPDRLRRAPARVPAARAGDGRRPAPIGSSRAAVALLRVRTPPGHARPERGRPSGALTADAGRRARRSASPGPSSCARRAALLGPLELSQRSFKPSETSPAVVARPGRPGRPIGARATTVVPVLRLDVELWTDEGQAPRPARPAPRRAPRPLRVRPHRPRPGGHAARAGRLPAAGLRLADRRRAARRAVGAFTIR